MEKTTDRLYLNPETREKIQAILELDGYVELELISKMGLGIIHILRKHFCKGQLISKASHNPKKLENFLIFLP